MSLEHPESLGRCGIQPLVSHVIRNAVERSADKRLHLVNRRRTLQARGDLSGLKVVLARDVVAGSEQVERIEDLPNPGAEIGAR